jgi:hypothetical protein
MAILTQPAAKNSNPFAEVIGDDVAPAGTFQATVIDIKDEFGVIRPKFENPAEMEKVDLTTFLFGFRDQLNMPHRIASRSMKISGNEKSALYAFLKGILGKAPSYGWDYCTLKGSKCLVTVEHKAKNNGQGYYPAIAALSPMPVGMPAAPAPVPAPQPMPLPVQQPAPVMAPPPMAAPFEEDEPLPF